jgi:hypothetical protein
LNELNFLNNANSDGLKHEEVKLIVAISGKDMSLFTCEFVHSDEFFDKKGGPWNHKSEDFIGSMLLEAMSAGFWLLVT